MLTVSAWSKMIDYMQASPQKIELATGQVFKGTVLQLYPNNMAKVQIGGLQVYAQLEAPLQAGLQYWLEVQSSGHPASLRVLTEPAGNGRLSQPVAEGLLLALRLPDSKENREIVEYMSRQQLPLSKELIKQFVALTGQLGAREDVLEMAALAVKKGLPVSVQTVQSLRTFLNGPGIDRLISHFMDAAGSFLETVDGKADTQQRPHPTPATGLNSAANNSSTANKEQAVNSTGLGQLRGAAGSVPLSGAAPVSTMPTAQVTQATQSVIQTAQTAPTVQVNEAVGTAAGTGQGNTFLSLQGLQQTPETTMGASTARTGNTGSSVTPSSRMAPTPMEGHTSATLTFTTDARLSGPAGGQGEIAGNNSGSAVTRIRELVELLNRSVPQMGSPVDGDMNAASVKGTNSLFSQEELGQFFRLIGVNHEKEMIRHLYNHDLENGGLRNGEPSPVHNGKHLLMQLMGQYGDVLPAALRESAEGLLSFITGQQLMAANPQGDAFTQVTLQFPLHTGGDGHKALVHMHSSKKGNGELDPDNCRLFFHLQMENLGETMLDVSIVDRVVGIVVFAGNGDQSGDASDTNHVADIFFGNKSALQEGLQQEGYVLSSFRVQPWSDGGDKQKENGQTQLLPHAFSEYRGVDVRV